MTAGQQTGGLQFLDGVVRRVAPPAQECRRGLRGEGPSRGVSQQPVEQGRFAAEAPVGGVPHPLDHRESPFVEFGFEVGEEARQGTAAVLAHPSARHVHGRREPGAQAEDAGDGIRLGGQSRVVDDAAEELGGDAVVERVQRDLHRGTGVEVVQRAVAHGDDEAGARRREQRRHLAAEAGVVDDDGDPLALGPRPVLLASRPERMFQPLRCDAERAKQLPQRVGRIDGAVVPEVVEVGVEHPVGVTVPQHARQAEGQLGLPHAGQTAEHDTRRPAPFLPPGDGTEDHRLLLAAVDEVSGLGRDLIRHEQYSGS